MAKNLQIPKIPEILTAEEQFLTELGLVYELTAASPNGLHLASV